jgi:hypothetical protein
MRRPTSASGLIGGIMGNNGGTATIYSILAHRVGYTLTDTDII